MIWKLFPYISCYSCYNYINYNVFLILVALRTFYSFLQVSTQWNKCEQFYTFSAIFIFNITLNEQCYVSLNEKKIKFFNLTSSEADKFTEYSIYQIMFITSKEQMFSMEKEKIKGTQNKRKCEKEIKMK